MPIGLVILSSIVSISGQQQPTNSESGKVRDQKAIDDAVNGWWKASMKTHDQGIAWWREAKFGCFIHWGVYSTYGGEWNGKPFHGYAEHMMRINKVPRAVYQGKRNFWRLLAAALSSSAASPSGLSSKRLGLADSSIETIKS